MADIKTAERKIISVGGSSTHVVLEFPFENGLLYMGSLVSLSYSTYRDKSPVFVCGATNIAGFAVGNRYVAGSMVLNVFLEDELSHFLSDKVKELYSKETTQYPEIQTISKYMHSYAKDDLMYCDISIIFASEYHGESKIVKVRGATFVNNGQVMSVEDLTTENTLSYVAQSVSEQDDLLGDKTSIGLSNSSNSGSKIVNKRRSAGGGPILQQFLTHGNL